VIVNGGGHPLNDTFRSLRRDAISAYGFGLTLGSSRDNPKEQFRYDRGAYGINVVKATLTTEEP